jgi:translocator protein
MNKIPLNLPLNKGGNLWRYIMNLFKLVLSILICESAGLIGSIFTNMSLHTWYIALNKPSFNPPNIIFPIVWNILFILMGISLYLIWDKESDNKQKNTAVIFFILQLIFNILWSAAFFGMRSPSLALGVLVILWIFILVTILKFLKIHKISAYLMIPYICWVSFAATLNIYIILLNR